MNNTQHNQMGKMGSMQQRVGKLIEQHVRDEYQLTENKRQQKYGYYDAYNKDTIFEIKAIKTNMYRVTILLKNHKELLLQNGFYIFVNYELVNKDKDLTMITDIKIVNVSFLSASVVDNIINQHGISHIRKYKHVMKEYMRINYKYIIGND